MVASCTAKKVGVSFKEKLESLDDFTFPAWTADAITFQAEKVCISSSSSSSDSNGAVTIISKDDKTCRRDCYKGVLID